MKILSLLIQAILLSAFAIGQIDNNTTVAKTDNILDKNGDVLAKMTKIPGLKVDMFIKTCSRQKDTTGSYITEFRFIRPNHLEASNITLILQFDKKFTNILFDTEGEVSNIRTSVADNQLGTSFQASSLAADAIVIIKVLSNQPVLTTITGIGGQLPSPALK